MPATIPSYGQTTSARWAAKKGEMQKVIDHERDTIVRLMGELDAVKWSIRLSADADKRHEETCKELGAMRWELEQANKQIAELTARLAKAESDRDFFEGGPVRQMKVVVEQLDDGCKHTREKLRWAQDLLKDAKNGCMGCGGNQEIEEDCPECDGSGRVEGGFEPCGDGDSDTSECECDRCDGSGRVMVSCTGCQA